MISYSKNTTVNYGNPAKLIPVHMGTKSNPFMEQVLYEAVYDYFLWNE